MAGWIKMPFGTEVGLGSGDIVLDNDLAPPKRGTALPFRRMSIVAKHLDGSRCPMPLGTKVGLVPDDIVLDGAQLWQLPQKGHGPQFSSHVYCGQTVAHLSYC